MMRRKTLKNVHAPAAAVDFVKHKESKLIIALMLFLKLAIAMDIALSHQIHTPLGGLPHVHKPSPLCETISVSFLSPYKCWITFL